jgi:hypothetical protein
MKSISVVMAQMRLKQSAQVRRMLKPAKLERPRAR